jgi:hypothetical protein
MNTREKAGSIGGETSEPATLQQTVTKHREQFSYVHS